MLLAQFVEASCLAEADLALLLIHAFLVKLANNCIYKLGGPEGVALVAAAVFLKRSIVLNNRVAVALALTNPSPKEFNSYAGGRLVTLASDELCGDGGLPMMLQLWVKDCPRLIHDQQPALAALAGQFSRRFNLGLASIYTTELGGQNLLPTLRLPQYSITTLGIAGQFVTLKAETDAGKLE